MMFIQVRHINNFAPGAITPSSAVPPGRQRPYIGLAWYGSRAASIVSAVVLVRGRTYFETLYATEAAAQAIDQYAPSPEAEYYEGVAGERVRFEARNQGVGC